MTDVFMTLFHILDSLPIIKLAENSQTRSCNVSSTSKAVFESIARANRRIHILKSGFLPVCPFHNKIGTRSTLKHKLRF